MKFQDKKDQKIFLKINKYSYPDDMEKIFFSGHDYFNALIESIKKAQKSIDLETYIFSLDDLGKKVIAALTNAAKKGVKVRILVDGAGTPEWYGSVIKNLEQAGAETRIFYPFPWRLWQWSRSRIQVPFLLKALYLLLKINFRNHRKFCIFDKKIVYLGSFNISQNHIGGINNEVAWRDTGICLKYTDLKDILEAFESTWNHQPIQERIRNFFRHINKDSVIYLNNTWHRRYILYRNLLKKIKKSKSRVWITNAYFIPSNALLRRLIETSKLGVDVRILLPQKSDISFMPLASQNFYTCLLRAGVRIFEYVPSILHAKTIIVDDWMTIGSSNLNHRSLLHDLEIDVVVRQQKSKTALVQQFILDIEKSKEVHLNTFKKRCWSQKIMSWILLHLKYLI